MALKSSWTEEIAMIFQVFDISINGPRTNNSDTYIREFSIWQWHMFLTGKNWYRAPNILNLKMILIYMILEKLYLHVPDHILTLPDFLHACFY